MAHDVVDVLRILASSTTNASSELELEVVTELDRLAVHGPAWDRLVLGSGRYRPQAAYAYVASYLEHLHDPRASWACLIASRGGALVGVLPFLFDPARAGIAGVRLDAAPLEADLVAAPGLESVVIPTLLDALARAVPRWVSLRFGELEACSPTVEHLRNDARAAVVAAVGRASYLALPATSDAYLARLDSHFRQNLRRQTKKLFALRDARVEIIDAREATAAHLDAFIAIEGSGWKARDGNAVCRRPELAAYYAAVTRRLADGGALVWALLHAEDRPVAAFLMVRMGTKLALDKIAYDQALSQVAPGNVLLGKVIEYAIQSGLAEVDFLTDHEWNRRWKAETRATFDVTTYRSTARALVPWYLSDVARRTWRGARP
jgi:CelD/BcsL family acetyltransferase involved in cellulose biosynthesis